MRSTVRDAVVALLESCRRSSDEEVRVLALHLAIEVLVLRDLIYLRNNAAPEIGPIGPPYEGLKRAGVVVGRRATECGCVVHSSDDDMLGVSELLSGPRPALADVDDVAAWRAAELRVAGDATARVELREHVARAPASFGYSPSSGPRHYTVVVVRGDGGEEAFS